jgi:pimeloyl-ACP methyl ester carboxylesterase
MSCRSALLAVAVTLLSGCFTREIAERAGASGWFRADISTAQKSYRERFVAFPLADEALACDQVPTGGRIVVLVHGLGGDRAETERAFPAVLASKPSAVFLFRWVPYDGRDELTKRLANGLTHLGACAPDAEVVMIAHSAGGVLASLAASHVRRPRGSQGTWLTIMTVASPLAGTAQVPPRDDGREEALFVWDLGHPIASYPRAARGVRVVHLRTSAPADKFMEPVGGHLPNDPRVGVRGAVQEDLPARLTHDAALAYVTERLADGSWTEWLRGTGPATAGR